MNELSTEVKMTVKEVAEAFGKDDSTIRKIGKELFPKSFRNGVKTYLNEEQVTAIKLHLGKNSELPKTSLEKELIIQQAMMFQQEKITELEKENRRKDIQLIHQKPKVEFYDQVANSDTTFTMEEVAKTLNMG